MGPGRLELPTSRLSGVRSNLLSYEPSVNLLFTIDYGLASLTIDLKKSNKKTAA